MQNVRLSLQPFSPIIQINTGHTQTILGHVLKSPQIRAEFSSQILTLSDGDQLQVRYLNKKSDFTISLFHGLGGSSDADYIQRTAKIAVELGWNVILVDHRGVVASLKSDKSYHSGRGADIAEVLAWAKTKFKNSKHICVGFSMSGSMLLNLLTGRSGAVMPDYAIVVNAPLDLKKCTDLLSKGISRLYDLRFYWRLRDMIHEKSNLKLPSLGRTRDIDEIYTSKMNGFLDANDYYERCSTKNYIENIKTLTFVLTSEDDPFIDVSDYLESKWPDCVNLTILKNGGHMGYIAKYKNPQYGRRWLDHYLGEVFRTIKTF